MKVTVEGFNYEGAHFRGFPSDTDGTYVRVALIGVEDRICDWILDNFSYGAMDEIKTIDNLADGYYQNGISNFDGCGGVTAIVVNDNAVYEDGDWLNDDDVILDLGEVDVDTDFGWDDLNALVREKK